MNHPLIQPTGSLDFTAHVIQQGPWPRGTRGMAWGRRNNAPCAGFRATAVSNGFWEVAMKQFNDVATRPKRWKNIQRHYINSTIYQLAPEKKEGLQTILSLNLLDRVQKKVLLILLGSTRYLPSNVGWIITGLPNGWWETHRSLRGLLIETPQKARLLWLLFSLTCLPNPSRLQYFICLKMFFHWWIQFNP